ncbi:hypothetical protein BH11ARM1_BH11ARM1_13260 [soil metagenome]
MEVRAVAKYVRVQPRKVRIIADEVRRKSAVYVAHLLHHHTSKSAKALRKVLVSAIANAVENNGAEPETLKVATIMVDQGPSLKRIQPRAMGRANRILKKTSHITVILEDTELSSVVKPHGTKAKSRPTFASAKPKKKATAKADKVEDAPVVEETPVIEEATPVTASDAPEEAGSAGNVIEEAEKAEASEEGAKEN